MTKLFDIFSNIHFRTRLFALVIATAAYVIILLYLTSDILFTVNNESSDSFSQTALKSAQITRVLTELDILVAEEKKEVMKYSQMASQFKATPKRINYGIIEQETLHLQALLETNEERDVFNKIKRNLVKLKDIHLQINNKLYKKQLETAVRFDSGIFDDTRTEIRDLLLQLLNIAERQLHDENQRVKDNSKQQFIWITAITLLFAVIIVSALLMINSELKHNTKETQRQLEKMAEGELVPFKLETPFNELGAHNQLINVLGKYLSNINENLKLQNQNKFTEFEQMSGHDSIGRQLNKLNTQRRNSVQKNQEHSQSFEYTQWVLDGIKLFNDTLSQLAANEQLLAEKIVKITIDYLNLPLAGFYTLVQENENTYLRLDATYAYEKKRLYKKTIQIGEGIVGAAVIEKHMSLHSNIPDDYFVIGSGMGEAKPQKLLVLPLVHNENVIGVLELASFSEFSSQQLDFIQQIAPNIAVALSTVKANAFNQELLKENTVKITNLSQTEQQLQKEIEKYKLQINELKNKEEDLQRYSKAIETNSIIVEMDTSGHIVSFNKRFEKITQFSDTALKHTRISNYIANPNELTLFRNGKPTQTHGYEKIVILDRNKTPIPILASLSWSTIYHNRTFLIGIELGEQETHLQKLKKLSIKLKDELEESTKTNKKLRTELDIERTKKYTSTQISSVLSKVLSYASFDLEWNLTSCNEYFLKDFGLKAKPKKFNLKDFVSVGQGSKFEIIEASLKNQNTHHTTLQLQVDGTPIWFAIDNIPVLNIHKEITSYFLRFQNHGQQQSRELLIEKQDEEIAQLRAELDVLRVEFQALNNKADTTDEVNSLQEKLAEIQEQQKALITENESLQATTKRLQDEKGILAAENADSKNALKTANKKAIDLNERLEEIKQEISEKENQQIELKNELHKLKEANTIFEKKQEELISKLEHNKEQAEEQQAKPTEAINQWIEDVKKRLE